MSRDSHISADENEYSDAEEFERVKTAYLQSESSKISAATTLATSGCAEEATVVARILPHYTISVLVGDGAGCIKNTTTVGVISVTVPSDDDDTLPSDEDIIAQACELMLRECQASLERACASRGPAVCPARPVLSGSFQLSLLESGRVLHYNLKLGVQCEEILCESLCL